MTERKQGDGATVVFVQDFRKKRKEEAIDASLLMRIETFRQSVAAELESRVHKDADLGFRLAKMIAEYFKNLPKEENVIFTDLQKDIFKSLPGLLIYNSEREKTMEPELVLKRHFVVHIPNSDLLKDLFGRSDKIAIQEPVKEVISSWINNSLLPSPTMCNGFSLESFVRNFQYQIDYDAELVFITFDICLNIVFSLDLENNKEIIQDEE